MDIALQGLNTSKSDGWDCIMSMVLKAGASELSIPLTTLCNACIASCEWPARWKTGDWVPVCKKDDPRLKEHYRPIIVQVIVNKVFEQLIGKQLSPSFEGRFSDKLITAYKKGNSCENAYLSLIENWKKLWMNSKTPKSSPPI